MSLRSFALKVFLGSVLPFLVTHLVNPPLANAQGLEINGGYTHVTGNFGTDGFDAGAAYWFAERVSLAANYDAAWDTTRVGDFEFTSLGVIVSQAHLQNLLFGPRFYFENQTFGGRYKVIPFATAQFGLTHVKQTVQEGFAPSVSNSDTAFSWMIGGGVDAPFSEHWAARGEMDFLRSHLYAQGQSRLRLVLGISYTFGERRR